MEGIPGWGGSQERPGVREAPQAAASELGALHHGALTGRAQQKREIVALAFRQTGFRVVGRGVDFGEDIKVETGTPLSAVWCGGGDEGWLPGVGVKDEERNQLENS